MSRSGCNARQATASRTRIGSASHDRTLRVWDPSGRREATILKGHTSGVTSVAIGGIDGRPTIVSASDDGTVRVWDPTAPGEPVVLTGHAGVVDRRPVS
jgi:WD40 repeat protein